MNATKPTLNNLPQEYFDENRSLYGAETTQADHKLESHKHEFYPDGYDLKCRHCTAIWPGMAKFISSKDLALPL